MAMGQARNEVIPVTIEELSEQLKRMYENARRNEASCQVHLFAILFAGEIDKQKYRPRDIVRLAGISDGYVPELSKGIKLASYVDVKPEYQELSLRVRD